MEEILNLLLSLLSKTHKKDKEDIRSLILDDQGELKEDALKSLLEQDQERVATIKESASSDEDELYGKAKRKVLTKAETELKEFFGVDSEKKGEELYEAIREKLSDSGGGDKKITEDDVKRHPAYQTLLTSKKTEIDKINQEWESKYQEAEKEFKQKSAFGSVESKAIAIAKKLNPVLSSDPTRANNQLSMVTNELKRRGYEYEVDGNKVVMKKDGKIVEDGHGNPKTFEDEVEEITTGFFDIDKSKGGGGTGNSNDDEPGGGRRSTKTPMSEDELREKLSETTDRTEREKLIAEYKKGKEAEKKEE